ncbi:MAG TPA: hypothetical protein PKW35_00355 [Nannocystaceae bacterium]|nr:hypothetical protein [Nannocystaceae bacterium]
MTDKIRLRVSAGDRHGELAVAGYRRELLVFLVLGALVACIWLVVSARA